MENQIEELYKAIVSYVTDMAETMPTMVDEITNRTKKMYTIVGGFKRSLLTEDEAYRELKKIYLGI